MTGDEGLGAAAMNSPKISVIVPHYRDLRGLDMCLSALCRQTFPRADFEIIVADNNSPEGEAAVARVVAGRARLVVVGEKGAGPARNGGVAASSAGILAFTDADCLPEPEWLAQGVLALSRYDVVGGRMTVLVDDERAMTPPEAFERVFAFDNEDYVKRRGFTVSANLFCRREVFDRVGVFRVGVSEDIDWSQRAVSAGFSLGYADAAIVGHPARRTWAELVGKTRRVNAELYALARARPGARPRWLLRCLALPASAVVHTPKVLISRALNTPGQRLLALGVLYRLRLWRALNGVALATARETPSGGVKKKR